MESIDNLGTLAAETAMRAAAEYIRVHKLTVPDYEAAIACIKAWCKIRLPVALDGAKRAFGVGMYQIGQATFLAEMRLAGIEAAKEFAWPADCEVPHHGL